MVQLCGVNEHVSSCGRARSLASLLAKTFDHPSIITVSDMMYEPLFLTPLLQEVDVLSDLRASRGVNTGLFAVNG